MNITFPRAVLAALAAALVLAVPARAGLTNIAQVPLLNITGTGTVKPNLMLLFDNSGSMDQAYTPDFINDNLCRGRATLAAGVVACNVGHPPFMSPDFNKQYYNPAITYRPPIKADGSYYNSLTSANTGGWTVVTGDGFNSKKMDLYGNVITSTNLLTGFPDLKWCDPNNTSDCRFNTTTYSYPDNTYTSATQFTANPYYYTIAVAEFCTDDTMTVCQSVAAGAAAPSGYPVPAKVRWCNSTLLINCQGKRVGSYIYPRYSSATGAVASYGTIAITATASNNTAMTVTSVTIPDPGTQRTITNGTVSAPTGTDTLLKQQTLASAMAASIIARTGLSNQYWACVRTPIGQPTVAPCSSFGITLGADNVVAVIGVVCSGTKSLANCMVVSDSTRAGWGITVNAPAVTTQAAVARVSPTAVISVAGTTANSGTPKIASINWGGSTLATNITPGTNRSSSQVTSAIISAIGAGGTIKAYAAGSNVTPACQALGGNTSKLCLVNTTINGNSDTPSVGALTSMGTVGFGFSAGAGYVAAQAAVVEGIPTTTVALSGGSSAPSSFRRVDIVPATTSYPKGADRSDCAGSTCTYAEEMTNVANWYAYYKTRMQMMKSAVGIAFAPLNSNYRVGYVKLSNAGALNGTIDLKPGDFTGTQRTNWYSVLYAATTSGSTPNRAAMEAVGRMFANIAPYNYPAGQEVIQYPCQQNFEILVTDGYWNGSTAPSVVNNDNVENAGRFCTFARGCVDGRTQAQASLADVALYWYNGGSNTGTVSLRPTLEPDMTRPGQVPAAGGENTHLHVNMYTLGLGMDGVMTYEPNYDTAPRVGGDFYNLITQASSGCPWNSNGAYVWPDPDVANAGSTVQERVDDMWHAAVNGHGKYFSASAPQEVVDGLQAAIANMSVRLGAAAAAATSTPNISQQDNDIFSDTFTTVKWYGELSDKKIDITSGVVGTSSVWNSSDKVGMKVAASSDTRAIYMLDTAAHSLKSFDYSLMTASERAWFDNKCTSMSQCTLLSAPDKAIVNSGNNLVNWLRGQQQYSDDAIFRAYTLTSNTPAGAAGPIPIVLGDIASSKPAFLRDSRKSFNTSGYADFKAGTTGRQASVFTAANDGMLHAFNASTGEEMWAYAPRITMKKLFNQASTTYGTNHQFTTDGSPELGDVVIGGNWKTILVAGLNGGGRGFYALDVTNPGAPVALWELCADASVCADANDADIGLTFSNPQFGIWNNKWVVYLTSGYNNVAGVDGVGGGNGAGYLYIVDVANGHILKKVGTGSGDTTTPSGLAKITAISNNPFTDPVTTYIYGGDNKGQMWRFDLTDASGVSVPVVKMGDAGVNQPITTRPEVTQCLETDAGVAHAQRTVLYGTGRLLDVPDTSDTSVQSLYMLKDTGATLDIRGPTMVQQSLSLLGVSSNINTFKVTNNTVDLSGKDGWFLDFSLNPGERMNLDPKVVGGGLNVVTNTPSSSSACSVGGTSNVYSLNACTGSYIAADTVAGSTLSNTSAAVGFIIVRLPSGALKMITTKMTSVPSDVK
ncbi:MAG: PilC/PilY family type IV pilus protein [Pseudomonadota bacterium]